MNTPANPNIIRHDPTGIVALQGYQLVERNLDGHVNVPWGDYDLELPPLEPLRALNVVSRGFSTAITAAAELRRRGFSTSPDSVEQGVATMLDYYDAQTTTEAVYTAIERGDMCVTRIRRSVGEGKKLLSPEAAELMQAVVAGKGPADSLLKERFHTSYRPAIVRSLYETGAHALPRFIDIPWSHRIIFALPSSYRPVLDASEREAIQARIRDANPKIYPRSLRHAHDKLGGPGCFAVTAAILSEQVAKPAAHSLEHPVNSRDMTIMAFVGLGYSASRMCRLLHVARTPLELTKAKIRSTLGEADNSEQACALLCSVGGFIVGHLADSDQKRSVSAIQ